MCQQVKTPHACMTAYLGLSCVVDGIITSNFDSILKKKKEIDLQP